MCILVVNNDAAFLDVIRGPLEKAGYDVVGAATIAEACRQFERETPDLVVVDTLLAEGSALELAMIAASVGRPTLFISDRSKALRFDPECPIRLTRAIGATLQIWREAGALDADLQLADRRRGNV